MRRIICLGVSSLIVLALLPWGCGKKSPDEVNLSPASWPEGELEKYTKLNQSLNQPKVLPEGVKGMVSGTSAALAVRAGVEALKQAGSAADAAIVTSLAQIALNGGLIISYAGILTMVYYEAVTGTVHSLNAGWNTVQGEADPLSVPKQKGLATVLPSQEAGRSVIVSGFMAGVQALHDRFGKLPFDKLFEPTIYFAEQGFLLDLFTASVMKGYEKAITRTPEMKQIFTKENGNLYEAGDLFKQPQLARTMTNVAKYGADYMYTGDWGKDLVEVVQKEGGKMTLEDLKDYQIIWSEPSCTSYRDYDVCTLSAPSLGGVNLIEALNLLELADIQSLGHYSQSPEALFWLMQISRASYYLNEYVMNDIPISPEILERHFPGIDLTPESRLKKETAHLLWSRLEEMKGWSQINKDIFEPQSQSGHSAAVVAVDEEGNVAAVLHTINGGVCNFVGGVSTSTTGALQQNLIQKTGPGERLPDPTNPLIVLKNGKPLLATSSIGYGLHEETLQDLVNVLDFGMNPQKALDSVKFGVPGFLDEDLRSPSQRYKQTVLKGGFSQELLKGVANMGQEIMIKANPGSIFGFVVAIKIDPKTGLLQGGAPRFLNGLADGY